VLVYSHSASIRHNIRQCLGQRPDTSMAPLDFVDVATQPAVISHIATGKIDVAILDGEATPAGGLGIAKQLKDELPQCPPIIVVTARDQDAWLAGWSRADAVAARPIDPLELIRTVVALLRRRLIA
jgi:DNA-binding response OmpR family regulator